MDFSEAVELAGKGMDTAGVVVLVIGAVVAAVRAAQSARGQQPAPTGSSANNWDARSCWASSCCVAADIIRTVAVTPTLSSVLVLALIVLIRTFLSFSLELEITGRWPWQKDPTDHRPVGRSRNLAAPTSSSSSAPVFVVSRGAEHYPRSDLEAKHFLGNVPAWWNPRRRRPDRRRRGDPDVLSSA